jgi:NAD(P)-dependent dehydrogenase (short-subunit alcohol dehydrogenase family)
VETMAGTTGLERATSALTALSTWSRDGTVGNAINNNVYRDLYRGPVSGQDGMAPNDVAVSNAGYGLFGAAEELTDAQIDHQIAANRTGSIQFIRAAIPHLRQHGGGRTVQLSTARSGGGSININKVRCVILPGEEPYAGSYRRHRRSSSYGRQSSIRGLVSRE